MDKICILSSTIYNKISAGEVVERPASVVKELIENAIDAKATSIKITISDGCSIISINDNGTGIPLDCLKIAFLQHSTSKIVSESDLDSIKTLGFRGEALASIAAVSKVTVTTKTETDELSHTLTVDGGVFGEITECGGNNGTTFTVENLFFNTPARLKFLKKAHSEITLITDTVSRLILSNPYIAIKYINNGTVIFNSQGKGVENAMSCIYGSEVLTTCLKIDALYKNYKVFGYISSPNYPKNNTTYQTLIINGRYVINSTINTAVKIAFKPYLMTRKYPLFTLYLSIPFEEIDVNVHPNKLDVRFSEPKMIFSAFFAPISQAIKSEQRKIIDITHNYIDNNMQQNSITLTNPTCENSGDNFYENKYIDKKNKNNDYAQFTSNNLNSININATNNGILDKNDDKLRNINQNTLCSNNNIKNNDYKNNFLEDSKPQDFTDIIENEQSAIEMAFKNSKNKNASTIINDSFLSSSHLINVGRMFNTYLIMENDDNSEVLIVDQHAAHERIIYDRLLSEMDDGKLIIQPLLLPYIFSVNNAEYDYIQSNIDTINKCGFEISVYGKNSFRIDAVPSLVNEINLETFVSYILNDINDTKDIDGFNKEKLARMACRAAIKGGDKLNDIQINSIINKLSKDISLKCPHGRPIAVKINKSEIEKWFKRIV
ncbi:MAG: DNA mismatch repair endonuclease MutL [Clostridia bacterium]